MKNVCNMHSYFKKHNIKLETHADYKYVKVIDTKQKRVWEMKTVNLLREVGGDFLVLIFLAAIILLLV